jgi:hypothetical protein
MRGWLGTVGPQRLAVSRTRLRNLAIGILRLHGWRNIAAALRRNARDATRVLPLLGITSPRRKLGRPSY